MGRWLKKKKDKVTLVYEAKTATATRAVRAENRHFPVIEMTIVTRQRRKDPRSGEEIDELVIYMDLEDASNFANQLLGSIQAATPRLPRLAARGMWGE